MSLFPGISHRSTKQQLKSCLYSVIWTLLHIYICNHVLIFYSSVRYLISHPIPYHLPLHNYTFTVCVIFVGVLIYRSLSSLYLSYWMLLFWYSIIPNYYNVWLSDPISCYPTKCCPVICLQKIFLLVGVGHPSRVSVPFLWYTNKVLCTWLVLCLVPSSIYLRILLYP